MAIILEVDSAHETFGFKTEIAQWLNSEHQKFTVCGGPALSKKFFIIVPKFFQQKFSIEAKSVSNISIKVPPTSNK